MEGSSDSYPLQHEYLNRKVLRGLKFLKTIPSAAPSDVEVQKQKALLKEVAEATTKKLEDAMQKFYQLTYKDWINEFWHEALRPDLLASLDKEQIARAQVAFAHAVEEECKLNRDELNSKIFEVDSPVELFIYYAHNFRVRTTQKVQAVYTLKRSHSPGSSHDNLQDFAFERFTKIVMTSQLRAVLLGKVYAQISSSQFPEQLNEAASFFCCIKMYDHASNENEEHYKKFAELMRESFGTQFRENTKQLVELEPKLTSFNFYEFRAYGQASKPQEHEIKQTEWYKDYLEPAVTKWWRQIVAWEDHIDQIFSTIARHVSHPVPLYLRTMVIKYVEEYIDGAIDSIAPVLACYFGFYKVRKTTPNTFKRSIPFSKSAVLKLMHRMYETMVIEDPHQNATLQSTTMQVCMFREAVLALCEGPLSGRSHMLSQIMIEKMADLPLFAILNEELLMGRCTLEDTKYFFKVHELNDASDHPYSKSSLGEWQEEQYSELIRSICRVFIPEQASGIRNPYKDLNHDWIDSFDLLRSFFGPLPEAIVAEALSRQKEEGTAPKYVGSSKHLLILRNGFWMCTEDPTLVDEMPAEIKPYIDQEEMKRENLGDSGDKDLIVKWHRGWSSVRGAVSVGKETNSHFMCNVLQWHMLDKMLESPVPLPASELLSDGTVDDEEYIKNALRQLHERSEGLVVKSHDDFFTIDINVWTSANFSELQFSDELN